MRRHQSQCALDALNAFEDGTEVTIAVLKEKGLVNGRFDGVKILGNGNVEKKLQVKVNAFSASAKEKIEAKVQSTNATKPKTPLVAKTPMFDSDATMIADISALDKNEIESINLDTPSVTQNAINEEDDDLFDDSFDMNAAIDELTQATEDKQDDIGVIEKEAPVPVKSKENLPKDDNAEDIFTTDAYDATSATSVADILNEMEGQLSLDIAEPDNKKDEDEYDANNEFDFLKLDDESDSGLEDETKKASNEEDDDEPDDFYDEPVEEKHIDIALNEDKAGDENSIDEDELFDQIDLSDFRDSDVEENIVLEDPVFENSELQNIGKHADERVVPIQLRNDINHLQTSSLRSWHPLLAPSFFIILLIVSFSQLAFFLAHDLVKQIPASRPLLEAFCETIGCHYSGPHDIKQIELLSRDVRLHPKEKRALLISAAMINNAYFDQPYPDIHIRLSDISGNVVAERIFNAKTYMGKLSNPFLLMKSKTPVHINFEVVDPGKDAVNFEFTFL